MYRIRLATGREQVYPSIQELTAGVQRGEVTAEAEIYHQRTERWLSIESHPHFRMALEGSTATRTSRLKFTRPSAPAQPSAVRPTPAAQKPDQGDLEELNRLLLLLDPLPTPAQRAEPPKPVVQSPPDLTLVRPEPSASTDPEPVFGTMLRLEDLESMPSPNPLELHVSPTDMAQDEHMPEELVEAIPEPVAAAEPARRPVLDLAPSDLGLPVEIHLDEIPVPLEFEHVEQPDEMVPVLEAAQMPVAEVHPVAEVSAPAPAPALVLAPVAAASFEQPEVRSHDESSPATPSHRRRRPMLFIAAAAIVAAAAYFFSAGGSDDEQGMVTLASATAPAAATVASAPADSIDSTAGAPASTVGFPMAKTADKPTPAAARDSLAQASILPSAPTIDLGDGGAERVSAGTAAAPRTSVGSGAELARSYARSYRTLQTEFAAQMERSGMVRLFGQTQISTADGLSGARRALDAAGSAVRQYHVGEGSIEKAFQDSARAMERNGATPADLRDWMTHASLKESREAADEGTRLLGQIDAVFALLQAQSGRYRIEGSTVRFEDSNAAARYSELQGWITRRLEHWSGQPASSVPVTVQPILEGIGLTRLPLPR
ncbi:MAG TPA: hypothetical protein P5319_11830 [Gemmatimonadales bacterium]|nr:hypothetical protein [Gemmatimonadales bacterium]